MHLPGLLKERLRQAVQVRSGPSKSVMDIFPPFIHHGSMLLSSDMSDSIPVKILRDTEASQSLQLSDTLMFSMKSSTGVSQGYTPVPLHIVNLTETLTRLLSKKVKLKWGDRCEKALEELYAML